MLARLIVSLGLLSAALAQRTTYVEDGVTVIASVVVDAETDPIDTVTLSVLTAATTARTTATPTTAAGTIGAAAVVGVPASSCTTEGCPVAPTTYAQATTVGGVVQTVYLTWTATTPTTPVPTWTSSGSVIAASQYITTVVTASGLSRISSSGSGPSLFSTSAGPFGFLDGRVGLTAAVGAVLAGVGAAWAL